MTYDAPRLAQIEVRSGQVSGGAQEVANLSQSGDFTVLVDEGESIRRIDRLLLQMGNQLPSLGNRSRL
jgi:hypothetical protein